MTLKPGMLEIQMQLLVPSKTSCSLGEVASSLCPYSPSAGEG